MNDFRIPKEKASVLVTAPPHEPDPRFVFLSPFAQNHHGAETPSDLFNVEQAFIPLFREDGSVVLARRQAIAWVEVAEPRAREWYYYESRAGIPDSPVRVEFDDGTRIDGRIALIGPAGAQRVVDVVNRAEGFLHLERGDDLFLVNLRRVLAVSIREEG